MAELFKPWVIKNISPYLLAWQYKDIKIGDCISKAGGVVIKVEGKIPSFKYGPFLDRRKITVCNSRGYKPCDDCLNVDCPLKTYR